MELLWQLASNKSGGCGSDMVWWRVHTFIRRVHTFSFHDVVGCRWVSLTQKTIYGLHSFDVHEGESHGMQNTTHGVVERGRVARVRGWSQKSYWNFWKIFAKMSKYHYQRAICLHGHGGTRDIFETHVTPPPPLPSTSMVGHRTHADGSYCSEINEQSSSGWSY